MPDGGDAAAAGLGEVAHYESARAELMAINPAWPKAALFTTVMPFILATFTKPY